MMYESPSDGMAHPSDPLTISGEGGCPSGAPFHIGAWASNGAAHDCGAGNRVNGTT